MIFAFSAGLLSTVNPCGFAMLPAYLSFFMGLDGDGTATRPEVVRRALIIGSVMSAGFIAVFSAAGILITIGGRLVQDVIVTAVPYVALVIGAGLVVLGVLLLQGHTLKVRLPTLRANTKDRGHSSVFVFGVSYAVASLSCTLPIFLVVVTGSFSGSFLRGIGIFISYGVGMAVVLLGLTLAMALGKDSVVHHLRRASRRVNQISGIVLVAAGAFIVYYWTIILARGDDALNSNPLARWVEGLSSDATTLIGANPWLSALVLGGPIVAAILYASRRGRKVGGERVAVGE